MTNLWYAAARALGFDIGTICCPDPLLVRQVSALCPGVKSLAPLLGRLRPHFVPPRHRFFRPREHSLGSGLGGILESLAHAPPVLCRGYGRWSGGGRGAGGKGYTASTPGVDLTIGVPKPRRHGWVYIRSVGFGRMVSPGLSLGGASHVGTTGGAHRYCVVSMTEWRPGRSWECAGQGWWGSVSNGRTAWSWILGCSRPRTSRLECSWSPPGALQATGRALFRPGNWVIYGTSPFSLWTLYRTKRLGI